MEPVMSRNTHRCRFWILMVLLSVMGTSTLSGCFVEDRDHGHWHDDHHDDHPDWH